MNVYRFSGIFSAFNFRLTDDEISIKICLNIWCDGNRRFLWHSMKTPVNFMKRLTSITVLLLAYLKH